MLKAKFKSQYKKEGKTIYVYTVQGTPEELDEYRKNKGANNVDDDISGKPLYFTTYLDQNELTLELGKDKNDGSPRYFGVGCPMLKLLRDKKQTAEAIGASEKEISRLDDRILDRELEIVMKRPAVPNDKTVEPVNEAPGADL